MEKGTLVAAQALLFIACASAGRASDTVRFADIAGRYLSSIRGGCELELRKDGSFILTCATQACSGRCMRVGRGFGIGCGGGEDDASVFAPSVHQAPNPSDWPPKLRDPTKGPFVVSPGRPGGHALWLEPLHWSPRMYLIQDADQEGFCRLVRNGIEPRRTPAGYHFLRVGDHAKAPGTQLPKECAE